MLNMNPAIGWLVLIIILLVIEIATLGLTTIWFAGGATAAFLSTFFGAGPVIQWMLFLVLSLAFLLLTRPMAVRYMKNNQVSTKPLDDQRRSLRYDLHTGCKDHQNNKYQNSQYNKHLIFLLYLFHD